MFPNYYLPPLDTQTRDLNSEREGSGEVSSFYKEIKEKLGLRDMDEKENNEDLKKSIKSYIEGINKHFMQEFKFLANQLGGKSTPRSNSSSPHDEKKTNGEAIFSNT